MEKELEEIKKLLQVVLDNQEKLIPEEPISICSTGIHTNVISVPDTITTQHSIMLDGGFAEIQLSKYEKC